MSGRTPWTTQKIINEDEGIQNSEQNM